jgi:hypothetical protein
MNLLQNISLATQPTRRPCRWARSLLKGYCAVDQGNRGCAARGPRGCADARGRSCHRGVPGDDDALPLRARRSRTSRQTDADGFGERWTGAGRFGEALQNLLPASRSVEPERDTPVGSDPLELAGRRIALGPSRIRQLLLRRVRDGAGPEEDREPARRDSDRSQRRR